MAFRYVTAACTASMSSLELVVVEFFVESYIKLRRALDLLVSCRMCSSRCSSRCSPRAQANRRPLTSCPLILFISYGALLSTRVFYWLRNALSFHHISELPVRLPVRQAIRLALRTAAESGVTIVTRREREHHRKD